MNKLKIYIFNIYLAIFICIHLIILPLLYFWLKQKYKGNNNLYNLNNKTEYLIENSGINNDETTNLLEDNNNNKV